MRDDELLRHLLAGAPATADSLDAFRAAHVRDTAAVERPIDRALLGGVAADRLGFAFAAGYAAALHALVPGLRGVSASLAVTEEGPPHPRHVKTRLVADGDGWRLSGHKRRVTAAGDVVLVLARLDEDLALVRVERDRPGVEVRPLPEIAFVPEVPHAEIRFDGVRIEPADRLPGDGWTRWVKPFRTVEDLHVHGALLGFLLGAAARYDWPRPLRARLLALVATTRALAAFDPSEPTTHVALAGLLDAVASLVGELDFSNVDADFRARWTRDRPLLGVAGSARAARLERAWQALSAS
jgi:hypothetical protein